MRLGFDVRRSPRQQPRHRSGYETVRPVATYAPWREDQEFQEVYRRVRPYTLVDEYRCYELWTLVPQTSHLEGGLLEVGVWRGGSGALIAERAAMSGINDYVYLCDTFKGVVKASDKDSDYFGGEHSDASRHTVEQLLGARGLSNARILEGIFPDHTGDRVEGHHIRFSHIDVDVYDSARDAAAWVWERMPAGGIIVYDDYGFQTCDGITRLVDEQRCLPDRVITHNLNGHAVVVKLR